MVQRHNTEELKAYAAYLGTVAGQFDQVKNYLHQHGCDKSGFTGLLTILQPGVDLVRGAYDLALDFGQDRMHGSAERMAQIAADYERTDQQVAQVFARINDQLGQVRA
ncbi:hypothetical protein [Crossiella cryophila]|uniref:Uncharacterized protein n=1 Tax=Crossiella cryophila TaxID=43355 RepID=A0A7W7C4M4_9PSEU|nr:hypothetical protein [Crossiella cryophila]MBB4674456.1 hypothetical protein [Crossiella cryophila]